MSNSCATAKLANLSCPINGLSDSDLEEIFKRLPPYERLIVSEVCRRWHSVSRKAWLDISKIDLKPIPGRHIGAILTQCSNLQSVVAVEKSFDANELTCLAKVASLKRVSSIGCDFKLNLNNAGVEQNVFSDSLRDASWTELILGDAHFLAPQITSDAGVVPRGVTRMFNVAILPASLTHLQVSGLQVYDKYYGSSRLSLDGLERLENLERFILHYTPCRRSSYVDYGHADELVWTALIYSDVLEKLFRLKNLKELCLGPAFRLFQPAGLMDLVSSLPKLEVLFLTHVHGSNIAEDLAKLITSNSALRVLVLTGVFYSADEPIEIPARKRFPHGFGSDPLPLLHVFVGKKASENIRFTKSTSDAAIIHPINEPMPEFLQKEDIAPIFKNVWIAEKIIEAAKHGVKLWSSETQDAGSSIQNT